MNFTPWETIKEAINAGAKYWSVYDATGKRLIFENNADEVPEQSAERLYSLLSREAGEFVQIRLSWKSNTQKAEGGNTRGFNYYYRLSNPAPLAGAMAPVLAGPGSGVPLHEYVAAIEKKNEAERERLRMELSQKEPSILERIATPENIDQVLQLGKALVQAFATRNQAPTAQVSGSPFDAETTAAVQTLLTFQDGKAALVNIAKAGPLVWAAIHQGLTENKLIP